jgi:hypothetical protein
MENIIINWLPWLLSANTLYFTFLAGNKKRGAWLLANSDKILGATSYEHWDVGYIL